jgi:hypothetical protein
VNDPVGFGDPKAAGFGRIDEFTTGHQVNVQHVPR